MKVLNTFSPAAQVKFGAAYAKQGEKWLELPSGNEISPQDLLEAYEKCKGEEKSTYTFIVNHSQDKNDNYLLVTGDDFAAMDSASSLGAQMLLLMKYWFPSQNITTVQSKWVSFPIFKLISGLSEATKK